MQSNNRYVGNPYFEVVAADFEFARYDADGDKRISVHEFAAEENVPVEDAQKTFDFADFNGDMTELTLIIAEYIIFMLC